MTASPTVAAPITIRHLEHGVVIPAGSPDAIPAAQPTVDALNLRMMYYGWPGMTITRTGDLLVSACQQVTHVSPHGRDVLVRSSDQGRTWTKPEVFFDSITDDRDIALNRMPDGTIIATWFSSDIWARPKPHPWMRPEWESLRDTIKPDTFKALHRGWLRRSTDDGKTWETHIHPTLVGQHAGPTPLSNGDLLYVGRYYLEDGSKMVATLSHDGGRTWQIVCDMPVPRYLDPYTNHHFSHMGENHVLEVSPGKLIAGFRGTTPHTSPNVHLATSNDYGRTWTPTVDSGLYGHPPFFLKLSTGQILCFTSQRPTENTPKRIVVMVSCDQGQTWNARDPFVLTDIQLKGALDMGYPVAVETSPGEVFCVYYCSPTPHSENYAQLDPQKHGILSMRLSLNV